MPLKQGMLFWPCVTGLALLLRFADGQKIAMNAVTALHRSEIGSDKAKLFGENLSEPVIISKSSTNSNRLLDGPVCF